MMSKVPTTLKVTSEDVKKILSSKILTPRIFLAKKLYHSPYQIAPFDVESLLIPSMEFNHLQLPVPLMIKVIHTFDKLQELGWSIKINSEKLIQLLDHKEPKIRYEVVHLCKHLSSILPIIRNKLIGDHTEPDTHTRSTLAVTYLCHPSKPKDRWKVARKLLQAETSVHVITEVIQAILDLLYSLSLERSDLESNEWHTILRDDATCSSCYILRGGIPECD